MRHGSKGYTRDKQGLLQYESDRYPNEMQDLGIALHPTDEIDYSGSQVTNE